MDRYKLTDIVIDRYNYFSINPKTGERERDKQMVNINGKFIGPVFVGDMGVEDISIRRVFNKCPEVNYIIVYPYEQTIVLRHNDEDMHLGNLGVLYKRNHN